MSDGIYFKDAQSLADAMANTHGDMCTVQAEWMAEQIFADRKPEAVGGEREAVEVVAHLMIDDPTPYECGDWDIEVEPSVADRLAKEGGAIYDLMTVAQHSRIVAELEAEILDVSAERNAMQSQRDRYKSALDRECDDVDSLIRLIGLDPDSCRTEGGSINLGKISAAQQGASVAVPDDWEDRILSAMGSAFEIHRLAECGLAFDDTQLGVEFACNQFRAMLAAAPKPSAAPEGRGLAHQVRKAQAEIATWPNSIREQHGLPNLPDAADVGGLVEALETVRDWKLPPTGEKWPSGGDMSYEACCGSNGARDYMRMAAGSALATYKAQGAVREYICLVRAGMRAL